MSQLGMNITLPSFTRWRARRKWAHIQACVHFGRRCSGLSGWLARRKKYDSLFREYLRIARLMQSYGHLLD